LLDSLLQETIVYYHFKPYKQKLIDDGNA